MWGVGQCELAKKSFICLIIIYTQQKKFGGFHSKRLTISLRIRIWSDIVGRFTKLFLLCMNTYLNKLIQSHVHKLNFPLINVKIVFVILISRYKRFCVLGLSGDSGH